jgi:hypothetical protein
MKLEFSLQILEKYSDLKFQENLSNGSQAVPCGQTDTNEDVAIHNFANALKNCKYDIS